VRLVSQDLPDWSSRKHFYGVAAHLMRQVLVDHARQRLSQKRGAGAVTARARRRAHVAAQTARRSTSWSSADALDDLARVDERKSKGDRAALLRRLYGRRDRAGAVADHRDREARPAHRGAWLAAHLGSGSELA
jgi:hypothetical protein